MSREAVEDYLRKLEAEDWGASLGQAAKEEAIEQPDKRRAAGNDVEAARSDLSPHRPVAANSRREEPSDASRLVELIVELGSEITKQQVRKNLTELAKRGAKLPLVATFGKERSSDFAAFTGRSRSIVRLRLDESRSS